jgi:hypothetical protein
LITTAGEKGCVALELRVLKKGQPDLIGEVSVPRTGDPGRRTDGRHFPGHDRGSLFCHEGVPSPAARA